VISSSVPSFVWGLSLVLILSLTFRLLPAAGYVSPLENPLGGVKSLILPVLALSLPASGVVGRVSRAALIETLQEPYTQFARSKGIGPARIYGVHALKNTAVPVITILGTEFAYILGDSIAVEWVFSLPGLGRLMMTAFLGRDYPVIQGAAILITIAVVLVTLVVDLLSVALDRRLRDRTAAV
jgi:peptide/nickel transport system permease protein